MALNVFVSASFQEPLRKMPRLIDSPGKAGRVNNAQRIVCSLKQHFNRPERSDITVRVGPNRFYLHKLLLAHSDVFESMMLGQWSESSRHEIVLEETPDCIPHMEQFFRYFYTAEICLTPENVLPIMILANKYNVADLEEACERSASRAVFAGTNIDQIIEWWYVAKQLDLRGLPKRCRDYMLCNMDAVVKSSFFCELSIEHLCELIAEKDMVITSEYDLYNAVLRWLHYEQREKSCYMTNLQKLLPLIKFCMMTTDELIRIENSLQADPQMEPEVMKYLYKAFQYHAIPFHKRSCAKLNSYDTPRLYTNSHLPKIGATLRLNVQERSLLKDGIAQNVSIPISLSTADQRDCRDWRLVFHEVNDRVQLEICSALTSSECFDTVEASVLIYKQMNGITFVKGIMQFRCYVRKLTDVPCGHIFNVQLPKESMDNNSPYIIEDNTGRYCQFRLVLRHYHGDVFRRESTPPPAATVAPSTDSSSTRTQLTGVETLTSQT